ncbi:uncharacterized protein LOC105160536 [Sesamum indicum]|uniref:Uncharacterized protein LOC105160536 n=1 Tax=Sesamum indicum TaxID=4182 RepID=A0A6I9SZ40_SESIN|nr:uncharacterized protein LOC105160536 [Sesamum indicum]
MGREWLYWIGGGGGGGGSGRSSTRKGKVSGELTGDAAATSAGCMCAVFQLFDLHHFPLNQQHKSDFPPESPLQEHVTTSKGVEAPRNSLELEQLSTMNAASMSSAMKDEENLNFPVGIQIKTSKTMVSSPRVSTSASRSRTDDFSSECSSNSPGAKTPSLVARLMGLDVLPECSSPSFSSSNSRSHLLRNPPKKERNLLQNRSSRNFSDDDISVGARSLPETPRISSARRSDVEYHRLSLQINKENIIEESAHSDKMVGRRGRFSRVQLQDENRSPGHYAKQIVKQVKESVSRRVGLDITNTGRNREQISTRRDENLILLKPIKKNSKNLSRFEEETNPDGKQSVTPSCSPRLRFLDPNKNKPLIINSGTNSPRISSSSDAHQQAQGITKPKPQPIIPLQEQQQQQKDSKKVGGNNGKRSSSHLKKLPPQASDYAIRNKKEEPFVLSPATSLADKKPKKTPLSTDILNILHVKKDPSPPPTKLPQKQVSDALSSKRSTQLSSKTSHSYKQLQLHPDKIFSVPENVLPDSTNGCATAPPGRTAAEYGSYIQRILNLAGIINNVSTPSTLVKWHTSSHPIDPSIFHHLELSHPSSSSTTTSATGGGCSTILSRRCNRKLIFQLVNELLSEILRPHLNLRLPIPPITRVEHFPLVDELCKKIDSFPASNCQVLEDIDSLIDKDLRKSQLNGFFEEEWENIVCELETEILESLVRETVATVGGRTADERTETDKYHVGASRDLMPLVGF